MDCIGIKVPKTTPVAKCVSALRKHLPLQIAEIGRRIKEGEYLYLGNFVDTDEVELALTICKELAKAGIKAECYEHSDYFDEDRPYSLEDLKNWISSCHEIDND